MSRKTVLLAVSVCFLFTSISVIGEDATPPKKNTTTQVDQHLLNELSAIRKKMGGSVLSGSSLDGELSKLPSGLLPQDKQAPADKFTRLVKTLREQSATLDRIANEIEPTKQYDNADQLRKSASELRKLARQFDGGELQGDVDTSFQTDLRKLLEQESGALELPRR